MNIGSFYGLYRSRPSAHIRVHRPIAVSASSRSLGLLVSRNIGSNLVNLALDFSSSTIANRQTELDGDNTIKPRIFVYARIAARRASTSSMISSGTVSRRLPFRAASSRDARLIAADYSDGLGACIVKRYRESLTAREASAGGDGQGRRVFR